jgi:hypothetical protein
MIMMWYGMMLGQLFVDPAAFDEKDEDEDEVIGLV